MERLEEINKRLSKIDPNMTLYKCDPHWTNKDEACGIYEGQSLDHSHDECHHPLSHDLADYIVNTPSDIQYLLSLIEEQRKEIEKLKLDNPIDEDGFLICPNCGQVKVD